MTIRTGWRQNGDAKTLAVAAPAAGQELEPRAYSPSPTGTTFLVVSATRSTGDVFTDQSAALTDVEADIGLLGLAVGHVFAMLGKSAMVLGIVPVAWGEATGRVGENEREASRRGLADPRLRLSLILAGSRPLPPADRTMADPAVLANKRFDAGVQVGESA